MALRRSDRRLPMAPSIVLIEGLAYLADFGAKIRGEGRVGGRCFEIKLGRAAHLGKFLKIE